MIVRLANFWCFIFVFFNNEKNSHMNLYFSKLFQKEVHDGRQDKFEIKESERQSWLSLAMIWTGSMICIPCLMIGGVIGTGLSLREVVLAVLAGYGIVCIYMCLVGMESCDTGMPTVSMASSVLGKKGAQFIISLMLAIACVGWFGIQSAVCGESFSVMIAGITGFEIPSWISSIFWGIVMLLTAVYGYNGLKILNFIAVPALVIVLVYSMILAFSSGGLETVMSFVPASRMSFISAVSMVVASFALGGVISGDYSRYARSRKDVVKSTVLGVFPSGMVMMLIGAILSIVTGQYDISLVLAAVGVPALGLVALVLATWTTNVTNAYSGGLAVSNLFNGGEDKFRISCAVAGLIGTVLAAVGLLSKFEFFLNILSALIPPIAGVMIASYWIVGKGRKENLVQKEGWYLPGIIAFAVGALVAYITGNIAVFFIGPVNGIVVSMVVYIILVNVMDKGEIRK